MKSFEDFSRERVSMIISLSREGISQSAVLPWDSDAEELIGKNYYTALGDLLGDEFLSEYTMRVNGNAPIKVEVFRLASGALRYKQGGTNFVFDVVTRNWVRIRRYDGTSTQTADQSIVVDLFFDAAAKRWIDASGRYILRKTDAQK